MFDDRLRANAEMLLRVQVAQLQQAGHSPAETAALIRRNLDERLDALLGETLIAEAMPKNDRLVLKALERLERDEGEPFWTSTAAVAAESGVRPISIPISMYRLVRDGVISREGHPGKGTLVQIIRRPR